MKNYENYNIIVHKAALWSETGALSFSGGGLSARYSESVDVKGIFVPAEAIDDYDYEKKISFIKLDIEGAEREALAGAKETIKRYHPVLAICAYHLQDDLLVLPRLILKMGCNYKLYLRHYMLSAGDTILYAIPEEMHS